MLNQKLEKRRQNLMQPKVLQPLYLDFIRKWAQ